MAGKYAHKSMCPQPLAGFLDWLRWTVNRILLFRPFHFAATCDCPKYLNQYIYLLTIGEIIFWAIFVGALGMSIIRLSSGGAESVGSGAGLLFACCWFLGQRNTLWNFFFGLSFERGIIFHKYVGRLAIVVGMIHGAGYLNKLTSGHGFTGTLATIVALVIFVLSIDLIRRNYFNMFLISHWVLLPIFAVLCIAHEASIVGFPLFISLFDLLIRAYYNFAQKVEIKKLQVLSSNVLRIEFDKNGFSYEAGQYVFICIPAISFWEWHPFSLSTHPSDETVMIHIRVLGNWTQKLHSLIAANNPPNGDWSNLNIYIEGPYGSVNLPLDKYENIVLMSGGIGITPMQSIFNDKVHGLNQLANNSGNTSNANDTSELKHLTNLKRIHFIWSVRDPTMFEEFGGRHLHWAAVNYNQTHVSANIPSSENSQNRKNDENKEDGNGDIEIVEDDFRLPKYFSPDLLNISLDASGKSKIGNCEVITHFYLTRVKDENKQKEISSKFPFVKFGRAPIEDILKEAKAVGKDNNSNNDCYACASNGYGVAVLSCGPTSMISDVKKYSAKHKIDCHTEIFEF